MGVAGSLGFAIASFFNAVGMATEHQGVREHPIAVKIHTLHVWAVFNSLFGSIAFVAGSLLYRVATRFCMEIEFDQGKDEELEQACLDTDLTGTSIYILGSLMFTAEACLNYKCMHLKWELEESMENAQEDSS